MTQVARVESAPDQPKVRAGYRPDIEGLRAVAIILVLLAHAGVSRLEGGYVGVDVFFVISGFLITQMLVREVRSTGRLRVRRFYARRARRLLPASAVTLVASALLAWLFLPQNRWVNTAYDIMFSAVYAINWRFAEESVNYMRADAAPSIVQHFWSLAVEEQFYILWPCLLIAAAFFARLAHRRSLNGAMLCALALVGLPSLAWSIYYTETSPDRAYFVSTTRVWELALGAAVAILAVNGRNLPRGLAVLAGWAGIAAIVAAGVLFTTETPFPGYWALVPTLGTAAVIVAGLSAEGRRTGSVGWILSTGPMETVGRLSYSLYLCHWPIIVVATAALGTLDTVTGLIAVSAAFIPAYLLHHHVENPIRFSQAGLQYSGPMLKLAAVTTVVSLTAGMALYIANWPPAPPFVPPAITVMNGAGTTSPVSQTGGTQNEQPVDKSNPNAILGASLLRDDPLNDPNGAPKDKSAHIVPDPLVANEDYTQCTQVIESAEVRSCAYGKQDSDVIVAVVGDSHANQWVPGLAKVAEKKGWALVEYTKAACSFSDVPVATKDQKPYPSCNEWSAAVLDQLIKEKPTMVITSQSSKGVFVNGELRYDPVGRSALAAGLRRSYEALTKAGIPVLVIQDSPAPTQDIPDCVEANADELTACAADRAVMVPDDHGSDQMEAVQGLGNVRVVDFNDAICPTDKCAAVIGNVLLYRDNSHMTGTYVRTLVPFLDKRISLPQ
ncbi:acyltransferase family protein [Mycolicibacterium arseniciresistens]|uniref:Acyltransferase family protein n=1 Tax=Mycolicibacterium arseniciresistens TaxID=3062257 RepID=A0ABT8U990_9MYCO|nr:acyltransferase family protein [Mycolicibacterium arseniciresistens]MDO3634352.1 acyltransferase family protein [Mycolicibacterium arseniciresistens]